MVKLLNYFTDNLVRVRRDAIVNVTVETVLILDAAYVADLHARGHTTRAEIEAVIHLKWMGVSGFIHYPARTETVLRRSYCLHIVTQKIKTHHSTVSKMSNCIALL